jgi:hypothetical protein
MNLELLVPDILLLLLHLLLLLLIIIIIIISSSSMPSSVIKHHLQSLDLSVPIFRLVELILHLFGA